MSIEREIVRVFTQFDAQCVEINDYMIKQMILVFNLTTRIRIIEENKKTMPLPRALEPHEEELSAQFETFIWELRRDFDTHQHELQHPTIQVMLTKFTYSTRKRIDNSVFAQEIQYNNDKNRSWNLH